MRRVTLRAPAKINLFLEIMGRRADGYHTLDTVFQEISLADTLTAVRDIPGRVTLTCSDSSLPLDESNLVVRAARVYLEALWPAGGVRFRLLKRIPVGAGLGGGSSDAATALKALWALQHGRLPGPMGRRALQTLARRLGADVPFFLRGGLARAVGIGDRLTPLVRGKGGPDRYVLVFPRVFSSTKTAYSRLRFPLTNPRSGLRLTQVLTAGAPLAEWASLMANRLEEAVLPFLPEVARVTSALKAAGCRSVMMSGSGSAVFGVVDSPAQGRRVQRALAGRPWDVWRVHSRGP
jgi:4-diphosphocytidyl-2-C-methyl-D-erythritol kinase